MTIKPAHPYTAIVEGVPVYGGDDAEAAMLVFEAAAEQAARDAGADMILFAPSFHTVTGNEERPVIEAHAASAGRSGFVGALYGVEPKQWIDRARKGTTPK